MMTSSVPPGERRDGGRARWPVGGSARGPAGGKSQGGGERCSPALQAQGSLRRRERKRRPPRSKREHLPFCVRGPERECPGRPSAPPVPAPRPAPPGPPPHPATTVHSATLRVQRGSDLRPSSSPWATRPPSAPSTVCPRCEKPYNDRTGQQPTRKPGTAGHKVGQSVQPEHQEGSLTNVHPACPCKPRAGRRDYTEGARSRDSNAVHEKRSHALGKTPQGVSSGSGGGGTTLSRSAGARASAAPRYVPNS